MRVFGCLVRRIASLGQRVSVVAEVAVQALEAADMGSRDADVPCLAALAQASRAARNSGWKDAPSWRSLVGATQRAPELEDADPGEMRRGWQAAISSFAESSFRELVVLPGMSADRQAMLRSQSRILA